MNHHPAPEIDRQDRPRAGHAGSQGGPHLRLAVSLAVSVAVHSASSVFICRTSVFCASMISRQSRVARASRRRASWQTRIAPE